MQGRRRSERRDCCCIVVVDAMCNNSHIIVINNFFLVLTTQTCRISCQFINACFVAGSVAHSGRMTTVSTMMIGLDCIFTHFTQLFIQVHTSQVRPTPSPTTNQPPIQPNISANIKRMRTIQVTILCPCMLGRCLYSVEMDLKWK